MDASDFVQLCDMRLQGVTRQVVDLLARLVDSSLGVEVELASLMRQDQLRFGRERPIRTVSQLATKGPGEFGIRGNAPTLQPSAYEAGRCTAGGILS